MQNLSAKTGTTSTQTAIRHTTDDGLSMVQQLRGWLLNDASPSQAAPSLDWLRWAVFIGIHLGCLGVFWIGISTTAVLVAIVLYLARMFFITGFYHRYFSHRTYKTSRMFQFVMACLTCMAGQRGPLWWAAHHRHHHAHSDRDSDAHSPSQHGFWWSHAGWFMDRINFPTKMNYVKDWRTFPELVRVNQLSWIPFILLALGLYAMGAALEYFAPLLNTSGPQLLVWGFFISTVALYHATYSTNSIAHRYGQQRFETGDDSRNNLFLAILTLGEGWHNNHHHYPSSVRQGFFWWEIDLTYYLLLLLEKFGLIWDLRPVPPKILSKRKKEQNR